MKRLLSIVIIIGILLMVPVVGFAAPDEVEADSVGNATELITFKSIPDAEVTTFENELILSGSGQEGVIVTLYVYNESAGKYQKVEITADDPEGAEDDEFDNLDDDGNAIEALDTDTFISDDAENNSTLGNKKTVQWQIGPSELFTEKIQLSEGTNQFLFYAEKEDQYEIIKLNVTLLKKDLLQTIKNLTINIKQEIKNLISEGE